jgi:hypothetical protein
MTSVMRMSNLCVNRDDGRIKVKVKVKIKKVKFTLEQATKARGGLGVERYSSTLSLTTALDGVGGRGHASSALPPGKTR